MTPQPNDVRSECPPVTAPSATAELRALASADTVVGSPEAQQAAADASRSAASGASTSGDLGDMPRDFGRYTILRKLGEGGMGAVFLAEDAQLGRQVALKTPFFPRKNDELTLKRFFREARLAATIQHPHVCPVHDAGEHAGRPFLTMAFVEGCDLGKWMQRTEGISTQQALEIAHKLALGLQAAHEAGVVHRDLKPGNVMMNPSDEPIIMDFGMARRFDVDETLLTPSGAMVGTPGYMAPEQILADKDKIGPATDIYSLGVILYELLTGWVPFSGSLVTLLGSIVSDPPPPLRAHAPDLPPELDGVCLKALAKEPARRYASAREFAEVLALAVQGDVQGLPPVATPTSDSQQPTMTPGGSFLRRVWRATFGM